MKNISKQELIRKITIILFTMGIFGIAFKFTTLFDKWIFFPIYPNIVDALFLIIGAVYLSWRALNND